MTRRRGAIAALLAAALVCTGMLASPSLAAPRPQTTRVAIQLTTPYKACSSGPASKANLPVAGVLVQPLGQGVRAKRQLTDEEGWVYFDLPVGASVKLGVIYSSKDLEIRPGTVKGSKFTWTSVPFEVPRASARQLISIKEDVPAALASLWIEARKAVLAAKTVSIVKLPKLIVISELDQTLTGRLGELPTGFDKDSMLVTIGSGSGGELTRYLDNGPRKAQREWERDLIAHEVGHWLLEANVPSDLEVDDGLPVDTDATHQWDKIYPDNSNLAFREGFAHAFSSYASGRTLLRYGCGSKIDFAPDPPVGDPKDDCDSPELPWPRVSPCADTQLGQYNELVGGMAFLKTWDFLGEGDSTLGAMRSLRALRWFQSKAARAPMSYRDVFDAVIQSGEVRLGSREDVPSSSNMARFMDVFSRTAMSWGGRVRADLFEWGGDTPPVEYSGNVDTVVRLTGPMTSCTSDFNAEQTVPIRGADYLTEYTGDIDTGPLDFTWFDDCIGRPSGRQVRLPYSVPRQGVGDNATWTIEVMYTCEDAGDEPQDRCKASLAVPITIARDDITTLCDTSPDCTTYGWTEDLVMPRGKWVEVMRFDSRGFCSLDMDLELALIAEGDKYGCRTG